MNNQTSQMDSPISFYIVRRKLRYFG